MSKQLDLVISILKESATAHKIGDTVWAKDSVKRYITHAGKIVDISPGKITIKKLSGALTTHNTEDVSKDYEHLNPNPYRKNESEEIEESFTVKDASGKVVHVALTQSAAEKKAAELQASTKEKHTAGYSREAVVKEEWNAAYAEGKRHGSQGTGNNGQKAKKDWGDDFHHYNRGFLEGRNAKAKSLKAVGQGYGKKTIDESSVSNLRDQIAAEMEKLRAIPGHNTAADDARAPIRNRITALKTQLTAAIKSGIKEEVESIEELNKSTVKSYKAKAKDEVQQAKKYTKSEYGDLAKRVIARRTKGLARVADRKNAEDLQRARNSRGYFGESASLDEGIIKKKKPHPDHAYHEKTNAELKQVMNLGDAEKGKVASAILNYRGNWDKAPVRVKEDLDESVVAWKKETMKKHGDVEFVKKSSTGGLNNRTTIARKNGGDILAVYHHARNAGTVYEPKNESSLEDLHTGKGDGKELKASPEYRRDRRRTAQMMAAQKAVQDRVKRGYEEDDKDLDESLDEAHKLGDRVKIVGGVSKDVIGVHGHIGEIRNGAFKGAPKTYTVDYQHPKHSSKNTSSIQLSKEHIRGAKPGTLGEGLDEGILSRITNKVMGAAPKEPKYKVGQVVSYETTEDQPDWKDRGRGKGTITKYSNGHYTVNGNPVNHFDIKKVHESIDEAKMAMPLKLHPYHTKSDAELRGIVKDAGETARVQKGMSSEGKYLDQMNDASTVLHYRSKGGKQIMATNPRMVAPKPTDDSIKAKLAKWKKNESVEELDEISLKTKINVYKARSAEEYVDDWDFGKDPDKVGNNILRKHGTEAMKSAEKAAHVANFGRTDASGKYKDRPYDPLNPHPWAQPKEHKLRKDGKIHKTETNSLKYDVKNRLKNWYNSKPNLPEAVEESLDEGSVTDFMNLVADGQKRRSSGVVKRSNTQSSLKSQNRWTELINKSKKKAAPVKEDVVEGSIEEVSTARLKSYAEKAREDAEKLTKQGDAAKTDKTKLAKYVKATKRHLNAHKADDKISSNEFYGKK